MGVCRVGLSTTPREHLSKLENHNIFRHIFDNNTDYLSKFSLRDRQRQVHVHFE